MAMNITAPYPVEDPSQVAGPRRAILQLAAKLGFNEERAGRAALIVTELGTNLVKHARRGEILLRPLSTPAGELNGLEIAAIDKGPGIPDPSASIRDGHSTSGTLGHGLGAIERKADVFHLYTHASGTAAVACLYRDAHRPPVSPFPYEVGAVHVSKTGEDICGDSWSWHMRHDRLSILVADGLGHGLQAYEAAAMSVRLYEQMHEERPARVIADVHAALRSTRGAALAMLALDVPRATAVYAGLGNITATVLSGTVRRSLVSHNGTAGHAAVRIQEFTYPVPPQSIIVMASDGLGTHWDLDAYPGLRTRPPSVIAAILYRDFSRRRDDVTVVVAKDRPLLAEKR